jgi:hypothetical protein
LIHIGHGVVLIALAIKNLVAFSAEVSGLPIKPDGFVAICEGFVEAKA